MRGDPTLATAEKGSRIAAAVVDALIQVGRDMKALPDELLPPSATSFETNEDHSRRSFGNSRASGTPAL